MMGKAMLKCHRFVQSLWALHRLVVSSITFVHHLYVGESGTALVVYIMLRGTTQIDDISTWLPPSLDTPWQNVFFEYINNTKFAQWGKTLPGYADTPRCAQPETWTLRGPKMYPM